MEDNNVGADNSNTAEEVVLETTENTEETVEETQEESVEEIKARLAKAEELATNYKVRAEKAEKLAKTVKPETKQESNVSTKDLYALSKANVAEEDISEIEEYAKFKRISISEALKSPTMKAILKEKEENRTVNNASNVGTVRRSSSKVSDDVLMDKASRNELPENESDITRLIKARKGLK
jgi:hypothetical protein